MKKSGSASAGYGAKSKDDAAGLARAGEEALPTPWPAATFGPSVGRWAMQYNTKDGRARKAVDPSADIDSELLAELPFPELVFLKTPTRRFHVPKDDPKNWWKEYDLTYQQRRRLLEEKLREYHHWDRPWDLKLLLRVIRRAKHQMMHSRPHGLAYRHCAALVREKAEHQRYALGLMASLGWEAPTERFRPEKMPVPANRPGQPWVDEAMRGLRKAGVWHKADRKAFLQAFGILPLLPEQPF